MMSKEAPVQVKRGAQQHILSPKDKRQRWFQNHTQVAKGCLQQLLSAPIATFMTVLVLALALALPCFLFTTVANVSRLTDSWDSENKISLYLTNQLSEKQVDLFVQNLLLREDLVAIDLIDPDQGMLEFKQYSGFADVFDSMQGNPLPAVVSILAKDASEQGLQKLKAELLSMQFVDQAVLDLDWIKRFNAVLLVIERAIIALSILLGFAVLLIIGNTIRLNVESRRDEILVSKLMGATDPWVRRPFLYTGIFYGLVGASLAYLITQLALVVMYTPVLQLTRLYQSSFSLSGLGYAGGSVLLLTGLILGLLGALLSVNKFLSQLEPQ